MSPEQIYLGSCILEPTLIDRGVQEGIKADHFTTPDRQVIWRSILGLHMGGKGIDINALYLELGKDCPVAEIMACEKAAPTQANGKKALKRIIEQHNIEQLRPALNDILSKIDDAAPYKDIEASLDSHSSHPQGEHHPRAYPDRDCAGCHQLGHRPAIRQD
jgi:replicative DNA helicase